MEMVDIVATSNFVNSKIGSVTRKQRLRVSKVLAEEFISLGIAKLNPLMTVCRNQPALTEPPGDGGGELSASLQVAQASPKQTAILLQGANCGSVSQSMTVSSDYLPQMSSGPVMEHGGKSTTKGSNKATKASAGRKTITLHSDLELTE
jgi:hypothetical protein